MIYLDNAATSRRKPTGVYTAMLKYALIGGGNAGRGSNKLSLGGIKTVISAQETAAKLFGVDNESNIIFTQNATYALNMAMLGTLKSNDHVVVTVMDHNSVLRPAVLHGKYTAAEADRFGNVNLADVRKRIRPDTKLVVCTHVSNVCGTIEPVKEIARIAHANGAMFLLDASQSAGMMDVSVNEIGCDMLACPGHKGLMGPMGTGILFIKSPETVKAVIVGGTGSESDNMRQPEFMPDKFHSGTLNIPAIAGLDKGMKFILKEGVENVASHEKRLSGRFRENIENMHGVIVYGKGDTGITAFNIEGLESAETAELIGDNIIVRAGYHCAPLAHKALRTENGGAVRVSFGYFNTEHDVKCITDAVYRIVKRKENGGL